MLQKAKILLNMLLIQYDQDAFLNTSEEINNIFISMNYRYIKYNNFFYNYLLDKIIYYCIYNNIVYIIYKYYKYFKIKYILS